MRYSPRNIRIACNHAGLTHFGGVYFFHEFLRVLQLRHFLARHLTYPRRNSRYHLSQMILALVYPIVLGLDRIETVSFLRSNDTFQYLTGLPSFPDPQTLRRFLLQAPPRFWEQLHRVNDRLLQNFIHLPDHRSRLIFDLDSTVVTVFGHQDGAEVGYNPRYLVTAFQRPCLQKEWQSLTLAESQALPLPCLQKEWQSLTLSKLRHKLFLLPGELTRPQNRPVLRLRESSILQELADDILTKISKANPLQL